MSLIHVDVCCALENQTEHDNVVTFASHMLASHACSSSAQLQLVFIQSLFSLYSAATSVAHSADRCQCHRVFLHRQLCLLQRQKWSLWLCQPATLSISSLVMKTRSICLHTHTATTRVHLCVRQHACSVSSSRAHCQTQHLPTGYFGMHA